MNTEKLTRVVVVTDGKAQEFWADSWLAFDQDDERTLKLFAQGNGEFARSQRNLALAEDLAILTEGVKK